MMQRRRVHARSAMLHAGASGRAPRSERPFVRVVEPGEVLCREGDPPGAAWVILGGTIRVHQRDQHSPGGAQELAQLGPGAVVGELGAVLDRPRSATVEAVGPVQVLEIPLPALGALVQAHPALARVLAHAVHGRTGLAPGVVARLLAEHGLRPEVAPVDAVPAPSSEPEVLAAPAHDPAVVYTKRTACSACDAIFNALVMRPNKDQPIDRASDFHQRYATDWTPYDYELWVCPLCLYTAFPADFPTLDSSLRPRVPGVVEEVVAEQWEGRRPDFLAPRTRALREQALYLALALYDLRGAGPLRQAAIQHRLAWCARERGDGELEEHWLRQALAAYQTGYREERLDSPRAELRVQYLCGELARRVGDQQAAVTWFAEVLRHPRVKEHPMWERLARDGWAQLRDRSA